MNNNNDIKVLRELVKKYVEISARPEQKERRKLWTAHNSLKPAHVPVLVSFGMWNQWCREVFGDHAMKCRDAFFREHERKLRMAIFHDSIGDDFILEPWITQPATVVNNPKGSPFWGVDLEKEHSGIDGGAFRIEPPIKDLEKDFHKLCKPCLSIDEEDTRIKTEIISEAVGDIITIDVPKGPFVNGFSADISTPLAQLTGLQEMMMSMYSEPESLRRILAFMRDAVLDILDENERNGNISLSYSYNQSMPYCEELPQPRPNENGLKLRQLWGYCAAQEYTLVSPEMHDEFLLQYQLPVIEKWGLLAYGCCEDLTKKIDMLRQVKNLRRIAVTPTANIAKCAEQIKDDYVISWRPNPTDMVCCGFDKDRIKRIIGNGLNVARDCFVDITLKDVETVEGDINRLSKWVEITRSIAEGF